MMKQRWNELTAVFLAACATLLFEITVTKVFEFALWANYAYLVISTAMFGLGLSGVILTRWPRLLLIRESCFLSATSLFSGIAMFLAFLVVNTVPVHLPDAPMGWPRELLHVGVVFLCLGVPFVFFGLTISFLLEHRGGSANVYYFADLVGAGIGSFILVPLIPSVQPQGLVVLSALGSIAAALLFLLAPERRSTLRCVCVCAGLAVVVADMLVWSPRISGQIPLRIHVQKAAGAARDIMGGRIEASGWSALSRVDIAPMWKGMKRVWIAGGVNLSTIVEFDGDFEALRARRDEVLATSEKILFYAALPHLSKKDHTVCMIGTSGGEDSLYALSLGARKVVGVEMDPTIVRFVTVDYRDYAGGLFTDGDYSEIVVDEGRSYLRRTRRKFDVIQQVNNYTPIAFQNGALNLSETYLLTVESFKEFYDHLTDDGILAISRYGSIRMLTTAVEMFRGMGMAPEEYSKHLFVCEGPREVINTFMLKKSPFTAEEIDRLFRFFNVGQEKHRRRILYAPYRTPDLPDLENNLYYKVATDADPSRFWRVGCFNFAPPTDQKPYFSRLKCLGVQDRPSLVPALVPMEMINVEPKNRLDRRVPPGDLPTLIVLFEAMVLASVFFGLPLLSARELRVSLSRHRRVLGYFACLGMGFIFVEICLIQRLVLFLGAPVYSIAAVLCGLLVSAGVGSLCSGRIGPTRRNIRLLLATVAGVVLLLHFVSPVVMRLFLGCSLPVRLLVALALVGAAGFPMGMPLPAGIRLLKARGQPVIPWAWATNGYFTVVGSALSVVVATTCGFAVVFFAAAVFYLAAPVFLARD